MTVSQPASTALALRSPCRCERNPMIDVPFFSFALSLGMRAIGLAFALLRSKTIRPGRSSSSWLVRAAMDSL